MNQLLAQHVLDELLRVGVKEVCICPAARCAPFVDLLSNSTTFECFYWYEERSAAFFALGKSKMHERPVGIITTSGTAVAELMPAAMEAYYSRNPLLLITADRPRRYRGVGAPQSAEQVGIFGLYAESLDLADRDVCSLNQWQKTTPYHINVCFEEPLLQ